MHKFLFKMGMIVTLVSLLLLAGCARQDDGAITIGYITKSASNQGWVLINKGAQEAAADEGVAIFTLGPAQQGSLQGQLATIEDMIARNVSAIAIAPVDSAGVAPAIQKALDAGIPVIAVDTAVEGAEVTSYVATDNLSAAASQGRWAAQNLQDGDEIIYVTGNVAQSTGRERRDGFINTVTELVPGVIIYEVPTKWTSEEAQAGVEDQLQAHPNVKMIVNAWDGGALAAVAALKGAGYSAGQVLVAGFDAAPNGLAAIREGWMHSDTAQFLYKMGYDGIRAAIAAARGESIENRIDTGHEVVTPDNVEAFIEANGLAIFL